MKKCAIVAVFIFISVFLAGIAQSAVLEWTNPTTFADGEPLTQEYLSGSFLRIYEGDSAIGPWNRALTIANGDWVTIPYPATTYESDQFVAGKWYTMTFVVKIDLSQPMADGNKVASDYATPVQYVVEGPPPVPPTGRPPNVPRGLLFR